MSKTLEEIISDITKVPLESFKKCPMSYDLYTQEAQDLNVWLQPDKDTLIKSGCKPVFMEELPMRIEILRDAAAKYKQAKKTARLTWKESSVEGFKLAGEMYSDFS